MLPKAVLLRYAVHRGVAMGTSLRRCSAVSVLALCAAVALAQNDVPRPAGHPATEHKGGDAVLERVLREWPEGRIDTLREPALWSADEGLLLDGVIAEWRATGDGRLFDYAKSAVDHAVDENGVIHVREGVAFPTEAHSLDDIEMGRSVLTMYRVLQQERYYKAAKFLHDQMQAQPKNPSGGYWHRQSEPNQVWLDGAFMAEPFLENYGKTFNHQDDMDEVARQLLLIDTKMRDKPTGLLRHGWDDSMQAGWAGKKSGLSAAIWARGMGWYAMALVDVVERMPPSDPQRAAIEDVARRVLQAVAQYQDTDSGLWWQVMDAGGQKGNYLEASASCMFVYALAKGVRLGVAPRSLEANVTRGWEGVEKNFVKADGTFSGTAGSVELGNGSFEEYAGVAAVDNDARGVGAYLLALSEITQRKRAGDLIRKASGKTVLMDGWFNSQKRKTAAGNEEFFHYKWTDDSDNGYSIWSRMFQQYGMEPELLDHAPTAADLKGVEIYVIVSPDIASQNPNPHFMDAQSAAVIEAWVKAGGVLALMENDAEHADQTHLDLLSDSFGIHFNAVTRNRQIGDSYQNTLVTIPSGAGGIFHHAHKVLMKGTCTITVSGPAKSILTDKGDMTQEGDTLMAVSHVGRGLVYANVDPWLYNEYTDGRKLPLGEDNFAAGLELTHWLVGAAVAR